jgi:hypothetical protein
MLTAGLLYYVLHRLGVGNPHTEPRDEIGEPSRVDGGTEA